MRMTHIYQPVMLLEILKKNGKATDVEIARAISSEDPTQIDYYKLIVNKYPGPVLTNNRSITKKERIKNENIYSLPQFDTLTNEEINDLATLLNDRLYNFIEKRHQSPWEHRIRGRAAISGSTRYDVIKRAAGCCEACGISIKKKNLEVDHIVPSSLGGKNDISNYQALCYTCNTQKSNRDETDFRGLEKMYETRDAKCLFCTDECKHKLLSENTLSFGVLDNFPVTPDHALVIPKRHVADYFDLKQPEINAVNATLLALKDQFMKKDKSITGFNIGINSGASAGQTIGHAHIHIIPRRPGDVTDPTGGVRNIFPGKGNYLNVVG